MTMDDTTTRPAGWSSTDDSNIEQAAAAATPAAAATKEATHISTLEVEAVKRTLDNWRARARHVHLDPVLVKYCINVETALNPLYQAIGRFEAQAHKDLQRKRNK